MTATFNKLRTAEYGGRCMVCHTQVEPHCGYISDERNASFKYDIVHKGCLGKQPEPVPTTTFAASTAQPEPTEAELMKVAKELLEQLGDKWLELVPTLVAQEVLRIAPRELHIKIGTAPKITLKTHHHMLPTLLKAVAAGTSPFIVGPAGSGKTTLGMNIAEALKRKFYMEARVTSEYKLIGYMDATGKYVRTQFRDAYEKGGVFLFDEVDASDPDALTSFNAALANGYCAFPDKLIPMHKDFAAMAAGNTYGRGADRQYVGRNQLDAATLDRFVVFDVDYDENLELALAGDAEWTGYVQRIRKAAEAEKVRLIVSPRASIYGSRLLAAGIERAEVEQATIWKGLDEAQKQRVITRAGSM